MNKVAAFALQRKNSILSMSEKMLCPPQPLRFWITPACAGKRQTGLTLMLWSGDHPCVCGEKALKSWLMSGDVGSPPRMRGKVTLSNHHAFLFRITPACAGKRWAKRPQSTSSRDHPRVCGEKNVPEVVFLPVGGSPPRVRGKGHRDSQSDYQRGIAPACAGKSASGLRCAAPARDHPRVCGEKDKTSVELAPGAGSPPRVRGKVET